MKKQRTTYGIFMFFASIKVSKLYFRNIFFLTCQQLVFPSSLMCSVPWHHVEGSFTGFAALVHFLPARGPHVCLSLGNVTSAGAQWDLSTCRNCNSLQSGSVL